MRNVRIEASRRDDVRPQELRLPRTRAQARRSEPLLEFVLEEPVVTARIAQPTLRLSQVSPGLDLRGVSRNQSTVAPTRRARQSASASRCVAVSSAIGSIHGTDAKLIILFSYVSGEWSFCATPQCRVIKWPIGQVKFALELDRSSLLWLDGKRSFGSIPSHGQTVD